MFGKPVTELTDDEYNIQKANRERIIYTVDFISAYPEDKEKMEIIELKLHSYGIPYLKLYDRNGRINRYFTPIFETSQSRLEKQKSIMFHVHLLHYIKQRKGELGR